MEFIVKAIIPASPEIVYNAWLDTRQHTEMTGGDATVSDEVGESFMTWDGYISGQNMILTPHSRIVQTWRTSDFSMEEENSLVDISFKEVDGKTELNLHHSNLPEHGEQYRKGWDVHYFTPMKTYFESLLVH